VRIEIDAPRSITTTDVLTVRATLLNDSFEPVTVLRNAFIGPNARVADGVGQPIPENVEATFGERDEPLVLQPFTFYGRERQMGVLPAGSVELTARYETDEGAPVTASARVTVESR
jgi:hypothetical protein